MNTPRRAMSLLEIANAILLLLFLFALLHPSILNPLQVEPHTAWTIHGYAFGISILVINGLARRRLWRLTFFDGAVLVYLGIVVATWPTSVDRHATALAIRGLGAQLAVYGAVRVLADEWPASGRVLVAALIGGIALLEWMALDTHLRIGLALRIGGIPPLDWNGREGLGLLGAIQCALLIGLFLRARSRGVQVAAILLIFGGIVELLFLYSRLAWFAAAGALVVAFLASLYFGGFRRSVLAMVVVAAFVTAIATPDMARLARMASGLEQGPEGGLGVRMAAWTDAAAIIKRHAVLGTGLGTYMSVRPTVALPRSPLLPAKFSPALHPHNAYLQQMAEVGVIGGAAYIAVWLTALWAGWRISSKREEPGHWINLGLLLALVAMAVSNLGENMFEGTERLRLQSIAWMLAAFVVAKWSSTRESRNWPSVLPARRLAIVAMAVASIAIAGYEVWGVFIRETPAVTIQGFHLKGAEEFGRGTQVSQAFRMTANRLSAVDAQFSTDRPLTLMLRVELSEMDKSDRGDFQYEFQHAIATQFETIKHVSGVEWRRIALPVVERSDKRWYLLRLTLAGVAAADGTPTFSPPPSDGPSSVAVIVSKDNVFGGGALWIADRRQLGSLSIRAFSSRRTAYERFRADIAPTLPGALRQGALDVAIAVAYQLAGLIVICALLFGAEKSQ